MKLYLLTQNTNLDYNTYDSCVVVARSKQAAVKIHPDYSEKELKRATEANKYGLFSTWAAPSEVTATYLGRASNKLDENEVICASFIAD